MKIKFLTIIAMSALAVSCASSNRQLSAYQNYDVPAKLPSNPSQVSVKVSLSMQRVYVMEGSKLLMAMPVSVGASNSRTPQGSFRIQDKVAKYRANTHGYAYQGDKCKKTMLAGAPSGWSFKGTPMPYWCSFLPNYGFHTGWVKYQPCTHGCIRLHENLAPKFYRLVSVGTPVSIANSQPQDALYGNMKLPPDAGPLDDYGWTMYTGEGYFSQHKTPKFE
jgi:hypothetical protein